MFDKIRERVFSALLPPRLKQEGIHPFNLMSFYMSGQPIYSDMSVKKATREGYKLSIYVYRAIRTIVQAASGIPWIILNKNMEEIQGHPFTQVWSHPNPEFSGQDNMEYIIAHLKLVGNALIQPTMIGGQPREFWICMPDMIKPIPSKTKGQWLEGWEITTVEGGMVKAPQEQFIHFMQFDPGNPYWGIGDLQAAARTVDTDNEAQDTQKLQLQNRNIPSGVFQFDDKIDTDEQYEEATRRVREKFLQKSKRGEPWVLGGGYKWQQMSLTPVEMDYIASRLSNLRAIAGAFGLDPWHLGDRQHSTYNNVSEARRALYEDCVIPLLSDIKATLNLRIAPLYGDDITITYDLSNVSAMRDDFGKKAEQAQRLFAMGVPFEQINDKLEMGFEEFEGWDNSYLPFNLMPAGSTPVEPVKMLTKALNLDTEEKKAIHWKRIDRRRVAWWRVVQKRMLPLYEAEGRAVDKAIKDNADVGKAKTAINSLKDDWSKIIKATASVIVEDFGNEIAQDLGAKGITPSEAKWTFDPFSAAVRAWVTKHAAESVTSILATNLEEVRAIIIKGTAENLTNRQIAKELKKFYADQSTYKAMRIARTETSRAAGYGQREAAKQSGVVEKKIWISSRDDRVRDEHAALDNGLAIPINQSYGNGEMYPGETSINCRCAEGYITE